MQHMPKHIGKLLCLLTAVSLSLLGQRACCETGPELFAPDPMLVTPTVDPAPEPQESTTPHPDNATSELAAPAIGIQVFPSPGNAKPSTSQDGWVAKGSHAQTQSGGEPKTSSRSSFVPPPASLPGFQASPSSSSQINSSRTVVPYPYGAPAPVPEHLGMPSRSTDGPFLKRLIPGEASPPHRGGILTSLGQWWNSLWGRKPLDQPATASLGSPNPSNGWMATPGVNSPAAMPWTATRPVETVPMGESSPQNVQPYATPYALPPQSSGGSAPSSFPLTAQPPQGAAAATSPSMYGPAGPPPAHGITTAPSRAAESTNHANTPAATSDDPSVYGGWSSTVSPPSGATGNRPLTSSTLPPYPHYSSGFGTAMPFPSASPPGAGIGNGLGSPREEKSTLPLIDRIRNWWADVTAPKGIQGRQGLLPPGPANGRLLGAGFRGRTSVPVTDPFSNYGPGTAGAVMPGTSGGAAPQQSPAVLPPPAPQLPLRQAW